MEKPLLHLLPLESYKSRYTELLDSWEGRAFRKAGFRTRTLTPDDIESNTTLAIRTGEVLDAVQRPRFAMAQVTKLLDAMLHSGAERVHAYASDFFLPGLESLPYSRRPFSISSFCWAQSFDQFDFTVPMIPWLRPWETMALEIYDDVFVASEMLRELMVAAVPSQERKIHVVGLPFNSRKVGKMIDISFAQGRDFDAVYSSRWDKEKNPSLFLDVVEACPDLAFAICTADAEVRGSAVDSTLLQRIERAKNVEVFFNLSKPEYFAVLNASRVQINTALQDWVSFTLLEALTFDCLPLYPNFRSFPETFNYEMTHLYRPFDAVDCIAKLRALLEETVTPPLHILQHHDGTLARISDILSNHRT